MINLDVVGMGAFAIPVVVAIIQALKMVGLKNKFAPLASIGVGVLLAFIIDFDGVVIGQVILNGVLYGLSASGLYSGTIATETIFKNTDNNTDNNRDNV